ncbi:FecR family protein [Sunxiuqinia sp. A32]|uniref:FecR family protein n=1 Tax=Sunxiuqinia sp. A32 TaxID=3461496 RepID=UPI0040463016
MKQEEQNKWEHWASILHNEEKVDPDLQNEVDRKDFEAAQNIFDVREKVKQSSKFRSADTVWNEINLQIQTKTRRLEFIKYAAVFLFSILLTSATFWFVNSRDSYQNEYATIVSPKGQISNITLFDGTNIWLNAGSKIKYKHSFNQNNREIILEGEALFSVTKNKKLPFIVHAGKSQIKVYGTEFNVKAYKEDSKIETVLIEGKVQFSADKKLVMMTPGEQVVFSETSGQITRRNVNPNDYTSWKGGKIYFNNEPLLDLVHQLERWYEVKFSFENDKIKSYRFSGVINKEKSIAYTLNIIQEINKVEFKIEKEQIKIMDK